MRRRLLPRSALQQLDLARVSAAVLLALGIVLGARTELAYQHQTARWAAVEAKVLAADVAGPLAAGDLAEIREHVSALQANPSIATAAVYDAAGRPLEAYRKPGSEPPPALAPPEGIHAWPQRVSVCTQVVERDQALGSVCLATVREPLAAILARHSGLGLLTVMAFLLLAMVTRASSQLRRRAGELSRANDRLTIEVAERARAEEALRQSQKMEALGQLTGGIAHDFNNLLQVVHGAFEMILRKSSDENVVRWAENGLAASQRGASLTRQLLAFSRSQRLELKPFVVDDLVASMRELLARTLGPDIELIFDLAAAHMPIVSDRTQLELAVLNLAINARDAMDARGRLTVSTRIRQVSAGRPELEPGEYVELRVSDTGPGMSSEVAERAFDPFFTTKGVGQGTGLGLSQVYGVAKQAGGVARIETAPGTGTTIALFLRRSDKAATSAADEGSGEAGALAAPRPEIRVLVVDDEARVRSLACDALNLLGYSATEAESGPAALQRLEQDMPDVIVMDYAMPGMSGAEAATLARRLKPELPIVFASGYADTAAVEAAVGADAVILRKPFNMGELARAVAAAVAD
jgi:signal transduction histidine kinase